MYLTSAFVARCALIELVGLRRRPSNIWHSSCEGWPIHKCTGLTIGVPPSVGAASIHPSIRQAIHAYVRPSIHPSIYHGLICFVDRVVVFLKAFHGAFFLAVRCGAVRCGSVQFLPHRTAPHRTVRFSLLTKPHRTAP